MNGTVHFGGMLSLSIDVMDGRANCSMIGDMVSWHLSGDVSVYSDRSLDLTEARSERTKVVRHMLSRAQIEHWLCRWRGPWCLLLLLRTKIGMDSKLNGLYVQSRDGFSERAAGYVSMTRSE